MPAPSYKLVKTNSATELVEALALTGPYFGPGGDWIFRGQYRDLPLLPSAFRNERLKITHTTWTYLQQAEAELDLIRRFYRWADRAGLAIPEESHTMRMLLQTVDRDKDACARTWPPPELWSLVALAQHHGVATRFLDWTYSPWIAAYFAAESALWSSDKVYYQPVIWAFNADIGRVPHMHSEMARTLESADGLVEVVTAPYGGNRYLAAQRGVHLLYRGSDETVSDATFRPHSFDEALQRVNTHKPGASLLKSVLPVVESVRLLRLLTKQGVSGATVFPGYDGVVRAMREEERWSRYPIV